MTTTTQPALSAGPALILKTHPKRPAKFNLDWAALDTACGRSLGARRVKDLARRLLAADPYDTQPTRVFWSGFFQDVPELLLGGNRWRYYELSWFIWHRNLMPGPRWIEVPDLKAIRKAYDLVETPTPNDLFELGIAISEYTQVYGLGAADGWGAWGAITPLLGEQSVASITKLLKDQRRQALQYWEPPVAVFERTVGGPVPEFFTALVLSERTLQTMRD